MYKVILFCLLMGVLAPRGAVAQQNDYSRARVYLDAQHNLIQLLQLGVAADHGIHKQGWIETDFSQQDLQLIDQAGYQYDILIADVVDYYQQRNLEQEKSLKNNSCSAITTTSNPQFSVPQNFQLGSMAGYFTYQEMLDQLDSMRSKYPNLISSRQIINPNDLTHEGRPIYWLKISDNPALDENEPEALYNSLHHAREPLSLSQLIYFMWYLLENYQTDPNIKYLVDHTELYFIPCINPDGYIYNEITNPNGGGLWRKNRRNNGNSFGVDLNRNYGYQWGYDNTGSSPTASSDTYRGTAAFSEPETRNVRDFCLAHDFKIALNYHSYGNLLVYPWAFNGMETADTVFYRNMAPMLTKFNNYLTGTGSSTVGYNSNGDADDWMYGEQTNKAKILSMTPEAGDNTFGFWPPSTEIYNLCELTLWQNLSYAWSLMNFSVLEEQSNLLLTQQISPIVYDLTHFGFDTAGTVTVGIQPLTSNIINVGPPKVYNLAQFQTKRDSLALVLNPSIQNGALVRFELYVDHGGLYFVDTIQKVFGNYNTLLNDDASTLNNWTNIGANSNWTTTFSDFYTAPSSITDSEPGNYSNNTLSEIILSQSIDLSNVGDAALSFYAKWDIEDNYDYVQVLAAGNDGVFVPLCGNYTTSGSQYQDENEPIYEGQQSTWVLENMSLNDFLGDTSVVLKIRLGADQWITKDGFYFDNMQINTLQTSLTGIQQRRYYSLTGQNRPNPADQQVFIPLALDQFAGEDFRLRVWNLLGQVMVEMPVDHQQNGVQLQIGDWPAGTYYYQLQSKNQQSEVFKMQIN